jgi:putative sigma-54 modulation protein
MRIQVLADGFELTDGIRAHAHKRLQYAIGWAHEHVELAHMRLFDLNGPKGGQDKCCRIRIDCRRGAGDLTIEETQPDLYVAIDRAADRARRNLSRHLERQREFRRFQTPRDEIEA